MTAPSAAAIAAKVLERAQNSGVGVSNLKLQKLVTLVQSLSVYATGEPAFRESVQAWNHGPAVKPLYGMYKAFGSDPITIVQSSRRSDDELSAATLHVIDEVWDVAGRLSASQLRTLSHDVGPWESCYAANTRDIVIPNEQLGAAWVDYLAKALSMANPVYDPTPVIGRGQLGYESDELAAHAVATFTPARIPARSA